jgi:hypothetical protein
MQKYLIPQLSCLICCLLLLSCEKTEVIRQSNGQTFCPLGFRAYPQQGPLDGCGFILTPLYDPKFTTDANGVHMEVLLKKKNTPFVAADPTPNTFESRYYAFHRTHPSSKHQLVFEKQNMEVGTRISLYIGKTSVSTLNKPPYMGDVFNSVPAGPSPLHKWQIYVQRELQGSYTLGYASNGVHHVVQSNILDFDQAEFIIENKSGNCIMNANILLNSTNVASFSTQDMGQNAIPDDYFGAFGMDILEALQDDCTDRPVQIRLKKYFYQGKTATDTYSDDFTCNTIWFQ